MINDGIQPDPVFIITRIFKDRDNPGPLSGLDGIVKGLADGFSPLVSKVKFNGVGICEAITLGFVRKNNFRLSALGFTPLGLIPFLMRITDSVNMAGFIFPPCLGVSLPLDVNCGAS
jgi:hypothetical protein